MGGGDIQSEVQKGKLVPLADLSELDLLANSQLSESQVDLQRWVILEDDVVSEEEEGVQEEEDTEESDASSGKVAVEEGADSRTAVATDASCTTHDNASGVVDDIVPSALADSCPAVPTGSTATSCVSPLTTKETASRIGCDLPQVNHNNSNNNNQIIPYQSPTPTLRETLRQRTYRPTTSAPPQRVQVQRSILSTTATNAPSDRFRRHFMRTISRARPYGRLYVVVGAVSLIALFMGVALHQRASITHQQRELDQLRFQLGNVQQAYEEEVALRSQEHTLRRSCNMEREESRHKVKLLNEALEKERELLKESQASRRSLSSCRLAYEQLASDTLDELIAQFNLLAEHIARRSPDRLSKLMSELATKPVVNSILQGSRKLSKTVKGLVRSIMK